MAQQILGGPQVVMGFLADRALQLEHAGRQRRHRGHDRRARIEPRDDECDIAFALADGLPQQRLVIFQSQAGPQHGDGCQRQITCAKQAEDQGEASRRSCSCNTSVRSVFGKA